MTEKYRRTIGRWRCCVAVLAVLVVALAVALIAVLVVIHKDGMRQKTPKCGAEHEADIDTSESTNPTIFHDITRIEMKGILKYLMAVEALHLTSPEKAVLNSTFLYNAELRLPPKSEVLRALDENGKTPHRRAKVIIFRGDLNPPVIEEYEVGPLPFPTYHTLINYSKRKNPINYSLRPLTFTDFAPLETLVFNQIDKEIGDILLENYDAKFTNCGDKCLKYFLSFVTPALSNTKDRLLWLLVQQSVEFFLLHSVDMAILVNMTSADPSQHTAIKIWYQNQLYDSLDDFKARYTSFKSSSPRIPFPKVNDDLFTTARMRGDPQPPKPQRGPVQVEPDGKRYKIHNRHIEYLGWEFHYKMSTQTGPQLFDVKYQNERIAYEISLQEIAVYYSAFGKPQRYADYVDGVAPLGLNARTLVPGADCPEYSTFLETVFLVEGSSEPLSFKHGACVFELNTGVPLRRHSSYVGAKGQRFYSGMPDNVLVVRSILTISNYDYGVDFIFHQGGALELKVFATGFISTSFYSDQEDKYGVPLNGHITGNLHHHIFNFKADLDVKGTSNQFETLNIVADDVDNTPWESPYYQTKFVRSTKTSEQEATYKFNFEAPKYLLIKNDQSKTKKGVPRSYRIVPKGMTKMLFKEGKGNEPSVSWARYQVAVTKYKDDEFTASSPYAFFDAKDPVMRFQQFIDDDENIVDEDLVAWISMGVHHIPHTEDLPMTPTVGLQFQCFILPYNYFDEDASVSSRDAIRIDFKDPNDVTAGVNINRFGNADELKCVPEKDTFDEDVQKNPDIVLNLVDTPGLV